MTADVTVIIPSRNRLWALPKAVDSCRDTHCNTEIIVVDDGSTDGTWEWLQDQQEVASCQSGGWGKPWAVNNGFGKASGKYVRFLDSDDWLPEHTIDEQYQIAEAEKADIVVAGQKLYQDEELTEVRPWTRCDDFIAQQLGECDSSHYSAFLFRKTFVDDIPHRTSFAAPDFASRDDRCFMLEVALKNPNISIYDGAGLCHRFHTNQRLQFNQGMRDVGTNLQHLLIYRQVLHILAEHGELTPRRRRAACKVLWPLAHWIARTHPREANQVVDWIYRLYPGFKPPEEGMLGWFYGNLGFRTTERILKVRRMLMSPFRKPPMSEGTPPVYHA